MSLTEHAKIQIKKDNNKYQLPFWLFGQTPPIGVESKLLHLIRQHSGSQLFCFKRSVLALDRKFLYLLFLNSSLGLYPILVNFGTTLNNGWIITFKILFRQWGVGMPILHKDGIFIDQSTRLLWFWLFMKKDLSFCIFCQTGVITCLNSTS